MLNDPLSAQDAIRQPRLRVTCNGTVLKGALKASVVSNNYYVCDTFSFSSVISMDPAGWWDVNPPLMCEIEVSLDGHAWQSIMVGEVDHQHQHLQTGIIEMEGRDLSARLIESKTQEAHVNQTSSEVAYALAAKHGFGTAITKTTTPIGRYYQQDHSNISLGEFCKTSTEWDLLVYLARKEGLGFDVFMVGNVLHFQPSVEPNSDPYVINWAPPNTNNPVPRMNAISVSLERSLTLAKDIQVQITSYDSSEARSFTKTARAIGGKSSSASSSSGGKPSTTQKYIKVIPNLKEDDAQQIANAWAHELTLHERIVNVDMPGELTLTPRNMVKLQGTATSFDQAYYIASIDRHIEFEGGFGQSMRLKNSSPRTQTQV